MSEMIRIDESIEETATSSPSVHLDSYPLEYQKVAVEEFENVTSSEQIKSGIDRILSKSNEKELTLLKNAQVLINNAEYERALRLLTQALKSNSNSKLVTQYIGQCHLGLGETAKAVECFKHNVNNDRDFQSLALLAEAYYASGSDQQAIDFYFQALEVIDANSVLLFDIYKNIGNIYVRIKEYEAAEDFYNRAYCIDPHSDSLLVNFGTLEVQKSNWQAAIERFREAINLNYQNDRAWVGLAISHREFGDHELSRANLLQALDTNPLNKVALQLIFDWSDKDGDFEPLFAWLDESLKQKPNELMLNLYRAEVLFFVQRYEHCKQQLEKTLINFPESSDAQTMLEKVNEELIHLKGA